jgi:hypothetical protein
MPDVYTELKELASRYDIRIILPKAPPLRPDVRLTRKQIEEIETIVSRLQRKK